MLDDITASADTPQVNSEFVTRLTSAYMQAVSETKASPMDGLQAIARVYRPGQTRHVTVHVCVAAGTVDEMKRDRVINKMSAQDAFRRHLESV